MWARVTTSMAVSAFTLLMQAGTLSSLYTGRGTLDVPGLVSAL